MSSVPGLDDTGCGRDPREMTIAELEAAGHTKRPLLDLIRQNCMDCVGQSQAEVRRCAMRQCPFWPYRMNKNPFVAQSLSEDQRQERAERLTAGRRAKSIRAQSENEPPTRNVDMGVA